MLRAVRFASLLSFAIEPGTAEAIRRNAAKIVNVSAERIGQEWNRMLADAGRARGFRLAHETGLLETLWPQRAPHAEAIAARLDRLDAGADAGAALACQLADEGEAAVNAFCRSLAMDNRRRQQVAWLVAHGRDLLAGPLNVVSLKKRMAHECWSRLVQLAGVLAAEPAQREALAANIESARRIPPDQVAPPPLLDGSDVMALGMPQGPGIGRILAAVYDEQLAGTLTTRDQAIARARQLASNDNP